jgi:uncharacterized membrane protein
MNQLKKFLTLTFIGGFMVVLPMAILISLIRWAFRLASKWSLPISEALVVKFELGQTIASIFAILIILVGCFILGLFVRSHVGRLIYGYIEVHIFMRIPGYSLIRDTLAQFLGNAKAPFSRVALVDIFSNGTRMTAFITDEHPNGYFTVFVPTGPNPTSGLIYHLPGDCVQQVKVPVEEAMRSIISCGAGSSSIVDPKILEA